MNTKNSQVTLPITLKAYRIHAHGKRKGKVNLDSVYLLHLQRKISPEYESVKDKIDQVKEWFGKDVRVAVHSAKESEAEMIKRRERQGLVVISEHPDGVDESIEAVAA